MEAFGGVGHEDTEIIVKAAVFCFRNVSSEGGDYSLYINTLDAPVTRRARFSLDVIGSGESDIGIPKKLTP